jgi:uncharacterized protein YcbX
VLLPANPLSTLKVDGAESYDEDTWKSIRVQAAPTGKSPDSTFHVSCRTVRSVHSYPDNSGDEGSSTDDDDRCKMPNVDQDTGFRHSVEPDKSLRKLRNVDEGAPHQGCLGMQMTPLFDKAGSPEDMVGWLEVGMAVKVLGRGQHLYVKQ